MLGVDHARLERWMPWLLGLATCLAFAPVFDAGFLNYDDPWLIQHNPHYAPEAWGTPLTALFDFSRSTRMSLGAEYLPMRDLLGWLESRLFGLSPRPMHAVSLSLYVLALLLLRSALLQTLGRSLRVELACLLFALHPIHVESVAWLAGQKDVLALVFVAAALCAHARGSARAYRSVPLWVLAAGLSKAMSVSVLALLVAQDLVLRRRPDRRLYAGALLATLFCLGIHLYVGRVVGMLTEPAGGSRYTALITMGPVWLRYLNNSLFPTQLAVAYDVPALTHWTLEAAAGYAFALGSLSLAALSMRAGDRRALFAWIWFFAPLAPVSQVLAPLQNRMADRYAWLSVLAPCLLVAWGLGAAYRRFRDLRPLRLGVAACALGLPVLLAGLSFQRSLLFSDSVLLFADATRKTAQDTDAPYQLGKALEEQAQSDAAMAAYREVIARAAGQHDPNERQASNNLARLLARQGELHEAERVLRAALESFPGNTKLTRNLAKVLRGLGHPEQAAELERSLPSTPPDASLEDPDPEQP